MKRSYVAGYLACAISVGLLVLFFYNAFFEAADGRIPVMENLSTSVYYSLSVPIALVALGICSTGFWVGWTILTIKVAPPMPEIVEKKDFAKVKAFFLCLLMLLLSALFLYGVYQRSYWAIAIPAAVVTLVVLGMVFWVGVAIITSRSTLPDSKKQ